METLGPPLFAILLMLVVLASGVWIFVGIFLVGIVSLAVVLDMPLHRIGLILQSISWRAAAGVEISAIPMFVLMAEIIYRTDISERLFRGLSPFVERIPGRLLHTNVLGCTLFAAVCGSSAATTAAIGKITVAELTSRGYDRPLTIGSLAGAGSLGLMIPPSIVMIVYGVLAEVSVAKLFAAGVLPGLLVAFLYSLYIVLRCAGRPDLAPSLSERVSLATLIAGFARLAPILILVLLVLGSIYSGVATPSEAAAIGVAATLLITVATRQFSPRMLGEALLGTVKLSTMICALLVAASFLTTAMGYLHIPMSVATAIAALDLSPYELILVLAVFYIVLGMFLEGVSMTVLTMPVVLPLVLKAGFDPVWFGVFLVIMTELAQITPPVGFNLFVLQGLTGTPIGRVAVYALPFFLLMLMAGVLVTLFPGIALVLPEALLGPR